LGGISTCRYGIFQRDVQFRNSLFLEEPDFPNANPNRNCDLHGLSTLAAQLRLKKEQKIKKINVIDIQS
jgi:hypothetical protein